jgi:hypothetical protein
VQRLTEVQDHRLRPVHPAAANDVENSHLYR